MVAGLFSLADTCDHTRTVVGIGVVISGCAFGPLKTRLLSAAYEPRIAASKFTTGLERVWVNHHRHQHCRPLILLEAGKCKSPKRGGQLVGSFCDSRGGSGPNEGVHRLVYLPKKGVWNRDTGVTKDI